MTVPPICEIDLAVRLHDEQPFFQKRTIRLRIGRNIGHDPEGYAEPHFPKFRAHRLRIGKFYAIEIQTSVIILPAVVDDDLSGREARIQDLARIVQYARLVLPIQQLHPCTVLRAPVNGRAKLLSVCRIISGSHPQARLFERSFPAVFDLSLRIQAQLSAAETIFSQAFHPRPSAFTAEKYRIRVVAHRFGKHIKLPFRGLGIRHLRRKIRYPAPPIFTFSDRKFYKVTHFRPFFCVSFSGAPLPSHRPRSAPEPRRRDLRPSPREIPFLAIRPVRKRIADRSPHRRPPSR